MLWRRRVQNGLRKIADLAGTKRVALSGALSPCTIRCGPEAFAGEGLAHHAHPGPALDSEADQGAPDGYATDERAGSVDWIEYPSTGSRSGLAIFFPQDRMIGMGRRDCGT